MANFLVEIPDEKLDFVIDLFKNIEFIDYQSVNTEHLNSLANEASRKNKEYDRIAQLAELRNTINTLQSARDQEAVTETGSLFRFPHGSEITAIKLSGLNHLLATIENYYRINVTSLEFVENTDSNSYQMDKYTVNVSLPDGSQLAAGYCNSILN